MGRAILIHVVGEGIGCFDISKYLEGDEMT